MHDVLCLQHALIDYNGTFASVSTHIHQHTAKGKRSTMYKDEIQITIQP